MPARPHRVARAALAGIATLAGVASPARAQAPVPIVVESPAMLGGQSMPREYTPDGRNVSPPLSWRDLPAGTRQIAVLCQDQGAGNPPPWVHWIIYNIPASARGLPEGIPFDPADAMPAGLERATQGNNGWGLAMYRGPAPPAGTVHEYEFVVFALDADLGLPPGLTRAELLAAIEGHVVGRGTLVPTYTRHPLQAGTDLR